MSGPYDQYSQQQGYGQGQGQYQQGGYPKAAMDSSLTLTSNTANSMVSNTVNTEALVTTTTSSAITTRISTASTSRANTANTTTTVNNTKARGHTGSLGMSPAPPLSSHVHKLPVTSADIFLSLATMTRTLPVEPKRANEDSVVLSRAVSRVDLQATKLTTVFWVPSEVPSWDPSWKTPSRSTSTRTVPPDTAATVAPSTEVTKASLVRQAAVV
ncbi:putative high expression lethality protein Hel10 [Aspergillus novofumigatus IBT 16806]|uniref:Uncharacterized protein n=1 Tax=Aspergillus novofumigatus (strain IBT 16806) TaxID=1392255 RepID=A0A2I1CAG2_ASPN1|nr:uncharacterized protein P174DRAFT_189020 [Aspergillus novofumigatus IBT 16806]PKX94617.1 hypothetical protein P174DRAFT_189020 [Aspergillus novofumigatus IBT 16806]